MFVCNNNRGFQITFANGYTISVQFGNHHYCDKRGNDAEVAAWGPDGKWLPLSEHDDVIGWQFLRGERDFWRNQIKKHGL